MKINSCNVCGSKFSYKINLGSHPCADTFVKTKKIAKNLKKRILEVGYCKCHHLSAIFKVLPSERYNKYDYSYTSDNSPVSRKHFKDIANKIVKKFFINKKESLIEIGSNDGTFLKAIKNKINTKVLGVDPSKFMCKLANSKKINSYVAYFNFKTSALIKKKFGIFNICYAANVFNHVDDIHDFLEGINNILKPNGNLIIEVPDLDSIIKFCGFDTIYHEHRQYFSKYSIIKCLNKHNFEVIKIEKIKYMSGSLRVFAKKKNLSYVKSNKLNQKKIKQNFDKIKKFSKQIFYVRNQLNKFLNKHYKKNNIVVGLGAATKGNTLLNFCNLNDKKINCILESSKYKINKFTPGSGIKIIDEKKFLKFDAAIILPWNITRHLYKKFLQKKNIPYITIPKIIKKS
jgi:ubiquinone/menaquinone biosynthesis C-methylase UbiE